jgi:hypothetical protein
MVGIIVVADSTPAYPAKKRNISGKVLQIAAL